MDDFDYKKYINIGTIIVNLIITFECNSNAFYRTKTNDLRKKESKLIVQRRIRINSWGQYCETGNETHLNAQEHSSP